MQSARHPSHDTEISFDASSYDERCKNCGATDIAGGGWGRLALPCPATQPSQAAPYLAGRFEWAAPGDQQEDAWLVRFCDKDCGEAIFTGPDAEREAWEYWNRYAPAYNIYVFRLARFERDTEKRVREANGSTQIRALVEMLEALPPDDLETLRYTEAAQRMRQILAACESLAGEANVERVAKAAAGLVFRIAAAGSLEHEGENFKRWKEDARRIEPGLRAALATLERTTDAGCD